MAQTRKRMNKRDEAIYKNRLAFVITALDGTPADTAEIEPGGYIEAFYRGEFDKPGSRYLKRWNAILDLDAEMRGSLKELIKEKEDTDGGQ